MSEMLFGDHFSNDIQKIIAISVMAAISNLPFTVFGCQLINSGNIFMTRTLLVKTYNIILID
jgi:hypothetical protein